MNLRPGMAADIPALEAVAFAAKSHWGYSAEQLLAWRPDLSVSAESLSTDPVCVAEACGRVLGFVQIATGTEPWELSAMWVSPDHMGRGVGRALLEWARTRAADGGQWELAIDADPNAEAFYLACGAFRVGSVSAPIAGNPDRIRPQLRLATGAA